MHFLIGTILSASMVVLPLFFQFDLSQPPTGATAWLVFVMSLAGVLGLLQIGMQKFVVGPMMVKALENVPTRQEFQDHVRDDRDFQIRVDGFIERYENGIMIERRIHSQRRGDAQ